MNPTPPTGPDKFYVVTRRDLTPGQQLAQCVHGAIQFTQEWPEITCPWYTESNFLVCLSITDEDALKELAEQARVLGVRYSAFEEPDFGDEWTAVALEPGEMAKLLCTGMDLALRDAEEPALEFYN